MINNSPTSSVTLSESVPSVAVSAPATFSFKSDWYKALAALDTRTAAKIYKAIFEYAFTGKLPDISDKAVRVAFAFMRDDIDAELLRQSYAISSNPSLPSETDGNSASCEVSTNDALTDNAQDAAVVETVVNDTIEVKELDCTAQSDNNRQILSPNAKLASTEILNEWRNKNASRDREDMVKKRMIAGIIHSLLLNKSSSIEHKTAQ